MLTSICNTFNPNKYADLDKDYKEALYYTQLKNNELTSISYEIFSLGIVMCRFIV